MIGLSVAYANDLPHVYITFNDPQKLCDIHKTDVYSVDYFYQLMDDRDHLLYGNGTTPSLAPHQSYAVPYQSANSIKGYHYSNFDIKAATPQCGKLNYYVPGNCESNLISKFKSNIVNIIVTPKNASVSSEPGGFTLNCQVINTQ